jgi:hypothetical protein
MNLVTEMLRTNSGKPVVAESDLAACIQACFDCQQACVSCADACLGEEQVAPLKRCIRLNYDCAEICATTGRMLSRQHSPDAELLRRALELCAVACRRCGDECQKHSSGHEHCRVCMEACRRCEEACNKVLAALPATVPMAH